MSDHDTDADLPVVEEIVGLFNPPPPPPCRWGCGETMKTTTKDGGFKCSACGAWQFLALWNGDWVEAEDIPYLRARASINPVAAYRCALQKIASADLKRCSAGWLQAIAKETLGNLEATPRAVLPHTPKFGPAPYGLEPHTPSWCGASLNVVGPIAAVPDLNAPRPSRWTKENTAGISGHVFNEPIGESVQCVKCGAPFKDAYYNPACSADG